MKITLIGSLVCAFLLSNRIGCVWILIWDTKLTWFPSLWGSDHQYKRLFGANHQRDQWVWSWFCSRSLWWIYSHRTLHSIPECDYWSLGPRTKGFDGYINVVNEFQRIKPNIFCLRGYQEGLQRDVWHPKEKTWVTLMASIQTHLSTLKIHTSRP